MNCKDLIFKKKDTISLSNQSIMDPPKEYKNFVYQQIIVENENIKLEQIKGMLSRKEFEKTWFIALIRLNRRFYLDMLKCNECNDNCYDIKYYTSLDYRKKHNMSGWKIVFINDIGYISEGYHRTTIAKFLSALNIIPKEITIPYVKYNKIDNENIKKFQKFQKKINLIKKHLNNDVKIKVTAKSRKINKTLINNKKVIDCSIDFTLNLALEKYSYNPYIKTYSSMEVLRKDMFSYLRRNGTVNKRKISFFCKGIKKLFV